MMTELDKQQGLIKKSWAEVREKVYKIEERFAKIVDEINPDKSFPVFLAYYSYGTIIADTQSTFLPNQNGNLYKLTDNNTSKEVIKHLGYGTDGAPMGLVISKQLEYFIDLKNENITIPWLMYKPGSFFPFSTILGKKNKHIYSPNGVLTTTAGARSTFMLPNIGCNANHVYLQREYNVKRSTPKSLYDHWQIFKEIINRKKVDSDWICCVMYFSEKWLEKIHNDNSWLKLKSYLLELSWKRFEYERNRIYYDITFSLLQKNRNLKPNPYLVDTAKHLFTIALGAAPGYAPAVNEESVPIKIIQEAFLDAYNLKKYSPTIIQPVNFNFEIDESPVYYSLAHPSTYNFSPKSRRISSTIYEMRELEHIMQIFMEELSNNSVCADTILNKIVKQVKFHYFHSEKDHHNVIKSSQEIPNLDNRFVNFNSKKYKIENPVFSENAKFVRGCISISGNG